MKPLKPYPRYIITIIMLFCMVLSLMSLIEMINMIINELPTYTGIISFYLYFNELGRIWYMWSPSILSFMLSLLFFVFIYKKGDISKGLKNIKKIQKPRGEKHE